MLRSVAVLSALIIGLIINSQTAFAEEAKKTKRDVAQIADEDMLHSAFCMRLNVDVLEAQENIQKYTERLKSAKSTRHKTIVTKKLKIAQEEYAAAREEYSVSCNP